MLTRYQQFLFGLLASVFVIGVVLVVARRPAGHPIELQTPPTPAPVRVHVTGAVSTPGVYPLPRGSIVQDALNAAGGPAPLADISRLNLAQLVTDGDQVFVPARPPTATPPPPTVTPAPTVTVGPGTPTSTPPPTTVSAAAAPAESGQPININTATLAQLDTLPGIGPAIAQRIIDYRTTYGPFVQIDDIQKVKGIGSATFAKIKDLITVQ